jgi:hypothetical protein
MFNFVQIHLGARRYHAAMPITQKRRPARRPSATAITVQRLDQMQDLLVEIRHTLDIQLRLIHKLRQDVDILNENKRSRPGRELYARPADDGVREPSTTAGPRAEANSR